MRYKILLSCVLGAALLASPGLVTAQAPEAQRISPTNAAPSAPEGGFSCPNGGALLINQQPNQVNGLFSDADCGLCGTGQQSIADDFILAAPTTVAQIVLWGGYFPGNNNPVPPDPVTVIFHQEAANLPGAAIDTQTVVPASATQTGVVLFGVNEIIYVVDITPVALPAGTFWVEIFTNSVGNADVFFWETGTLDPVNGRSNNAFAQQAPGVTWLTGNPPADSAFALCESPIMDADLSVTKVADSSQVGPGDTVTYTITVANAGPDDALQTVVADAFPAALINVNWTCAPTAGSSCTAVGAGDINDLADVLAGGSVTYTVTATVDPNFSGSISNTVTITPGPNVNDPTPADQSSTAVVGVIQNTLEIPTLGQLGIALLALGLAVAALIALRRRAG